MAAAGVDVSPPTVHTLPGSVNIPLAQFPPAAQVGAVEADKEAAAAVEALNHALSNADYQTASELFAKDGFWRDHLALSWEFRTVQSQDGILEFLQACAKSRDGFRLQRISLDTSTPSRQPAVVPIDGEAKVHGIHAFFLFETVIGSGEGTMRLVLEHGKWRLFTLYTSLRELKGHQEGTFHRRPTGVEHGGKPGRKNWAERRRLESDFSDGAEPQVLIVGAGQAGLTVAARLKMQGLHALVIDRNDRVGDNWRKRYHQLVLHDPVFYDHLPYMNFPPQWPIFAPKDKLAQFFEAYANLLELNVWMKTELSDCKWDEKQGAWTVTVVRKTDDGTSLTRTFHPRHVIQATGHSGKKSQPPIKGAESFKGDRICHSSEFLGAPEGSAGKKAVVVGCCNSGHDIAQDFAEKGLDCTIVQRSSTHVVSSAAIMEIALKGIYSEDGPPVQDADMLVQGLPNSVLKAIQVSVAERQREFDKEMLAGLEKAGFKVDHGPDDSGLFFKYFQRGGGYYIDVGAAKLIADGTIKVKQGQEIVEILPHGLRFADGTELEADEIVLATGFQSMKSHTRDMFGAAVADRVDDVWGLNEEGEWRTMWQRSGHENFWFHGGNLALCRFYSRLLALQIKGLEEGLYKYGEK
ncbi:Putative indole-3-pyruvate monooxygenase [Tolypocladium paradoxum]|uniref:Indole-3-pyruvate monooxygenase n=1 Tax=Tolypocladium paradoxum TaxID=94208 RepID=A0A2S4L0J2_9HYPO|nr:Putative indole-3-pyruvate monooxygenase [Tolypocladium paradoxum]